MTGPTRVSQTIGELMGELMKATSNPDRITAAAQVLATLELADAVRSTVPRATFVNTEFTGRFICGARQHLHNRVCARPDRHPDRHASDDGAVWA